MCAPEDSNLARQHYQCCAFNPTARRARGLPAVPVRVERTTSRVSAERSHHAELRNHGAPAGSRAQDLPLTRRTLYLTELQGHGAADRPRTGDLLLGEQAFFQLNYSRIGVDDGP